MMLSRHLPHQENPEWRDDLQEFIIFGAFDDAVHAGEFCAQHLMQACRFFKEIKSGTHFVRDFRFAFISLAFELSVGTDFVLQAQKPAGEV